MLLNLESGAYAFTADPDEGVVIVGRENDCNFIVKEDGVSRHHCKLWFEEGQWKVEDSQSRHGTLVNNKQIHKPAVLKNGDVLKLAGVNFMVSLHVTNDPKDIGKALAGGAREKLKMLNAPPKGPPARPTRVMKAPPKSKPYSADAADDEPTAAEAPPREEPAAEETAAPSESSDTADAAAGEADTESVSVASKEKPTGSKLRPGVKGSAQKSRAGAKGAKPAKEAPKKGGGMLKILAAVVIFAGAGAAAYFGLKGNGDAGKEKPGETKKQDPAKEEPKKEEAKKEEAVPNIPAKPGDGSEAPKDPAAAPKTDDKPANPAP